MSNKLKVLGLALVAVFGTSSVMASVAQATSEGQFTSLEGYPSTITATPTETHKFVTAAGSFTCENAKTSFDGTVASASPSLSVTATYGGCLVGGLVSVTVDMNECEYKLKSGAALSEESVSGTVDIACPAGKEITVTVPSTGCTIHVPPQGPLSKITYTNNTSTTPKTVDLGIAITTITYTQTASCIGGAQTNHNGSYSGKAAVKGSKGGVTVDTTSA